MIKKVSIYCRHDNQKAIKWSQKIEKWLRRKYPRVKIEDKKPDAVIVLGGDGTILSAVEEYQKKNPIILGLNLGHVGFLASSSNQKNFLTALDAFFRGEYRVTKRMTLEARVMRKKKKVFSLSSLNEISVQNLLGMVEVGVSIDGYAVQRIHGTGVLAATPTGSTAFNLSAHGPIVMPDIHCLIITEIMDHNIPTPSIVVGKEREITLQILNFRKRGLLKIASGGEEADAVVTGDSDTIFPLKVGDTIKIRCAPRFIKMAELERDYFFKSLQEKFTFR